MKEDTLNLLVEGDAKRFVGLAGPGTGKSHTFKMIANNEKLKGKKILVLSFINKLVNDLADDFSNYPNVNVATLHSFALKEYQRLTSNTKISLIDDLDSIISEDYEILEGKSIDYAKKMCELDLNDTEKTFYKARSQYYGSTDRMYSFNSIIHAVNSIYALDIKHINSSYDLILVDEFQDFNKLEYEFIKYLNQKSKIVLVGDDDQSLYDWKYAQPSLIRTLYRHEDSVPFSLDYCYRCTEVIVRAVNSLIENAKADGYLNERVNDKKYLYPHKAGDEQYKISEKYPSIDFFQRQNGEQLIYKLAAQIRKDTEENDGARVLVITPSYLKNKLYDGLHSKGYNVVDYEILADEQLNDMRHKRIFEVFETLCIRKTDNLMLRRVLRLYLDSSNLGDIILQGSSQKKKIWNLLSDEVKSCIEEDIRIYKKAKSGKDRLANDELIRFAELFSLKNLISTMIKGFGSTRRGAQEIELTTVMSSKGLSADFVYYIGIDDRRMTDKNTGELTDQRICKFLVGITRVKKRLVLFSLYDDSPKILNLIDTKLVKIIKAKASSG